MAQQHLTDRERELILKFAANPLDFFSGETRGWLEDFIHLSGPTGVGSGGGSHVVGHFAWIARDLTAETGPYVYEDDSGQYLYCNGAEVSQTTYSDLYAYFGANAWGTDSGGNFFLPDARGRAAYFCGTHADTDLGDNDGITLASRRAKHQHDVTGSGDTSQDSAGTPAGTIAITPNPHKHAVPTVFDQTNGSGNIQRGLTGNAGSNDTDTTSLSAAFTGSALAAHGHTVILTGTAGSGMELDAPAYIYIGSLVVRF